MENDPFITIERNLRELLAPEYKLKEWGEGPWVEEPNDFEFEHLGFKCVGIRMLVGQWCGYIEIPKDHPWYGLDLYDESSILSEIEVHGGVTYAETNLQGQAPELYFIGFDCAHLEDYIPGSLSTASLIRKLYDDFRKNMNIDTLGEIIKQTYRDINFVKEELMKLAMQAYEAQAEAK